jgi:hypothetical protein
VAIQKKEFMPYDTFMDLKTKYSLLNICGYFACPLRIVFFIWSLNFEFVIVEAERKNKFCCGILWA